MKIQKEETQLIGSFIFTNGVIKRDEVVNRIDWLRTNYLIHIATDHSGWEALYQDPNDKRLWELTFPQSEMHGGGPPALFCVSEEEAKEKYTF